MTLAYDTQRTALVSSSDGSPAKADDGSNEQRASELGQSGFVATASDELSGEAFVDAMVPRVSRTFALSIEALPRALRTSVGTSYLLCRIVDTIEDEPTIQPERRIQLFAQFRALMVGNGDVEAFRSASEWFKEDRADLELCRGTHHVISVYRNLEPGAKAAILSPVLELTEGMDEYTRRAAKEGQLRISDLADLDRYCYFVAGTVGELLTGLFLRHASNVDHALQHAVRSRAVAFGRGLQLINILRDIGTDQERDVCFLPTDLMNTEGLDPQRILEPAMLKPRAQVLRTVSEHARKQLIEAVAYTLAWPPEEEAIRFFCSVPLGLALGTLRRVVHDTDAGRIPKMGRDEVLTLFAQAREVAGQEDGLRALLEGLLEAPSPSTAI